MKKCDIISRSFFIKVKCFKVSLSKFYIDPSKVYIRGTYIIIRRVAAVFLDLLRNSKKDNKNMAM